MTILLSILGAVLLVGIVIGRVIDRINRLTFEETIRCYHPELVGVVQVNGSVAKVVALHTEVME